MGSDSGTKQFHVTLAKLKWRLFKNNLLYIVLAWLLFAGLFVWKSSYFLQNGEGEVEQHVSSTDDQPLAIIKPNFMPRQLFEEMQRLLPTHPFIQKNELNEDSFSATKGWLVKFNLKGMEHFRTIPEFQVVLPYFDSVRRPESNAFVMNLLIAGETPPGDDAVGVHQDDTVGIDHEDDFYAHQVDVLYLTIPQGFQGGQLEAWPYQNEILENDRVIVHPAENTLVEFKGTAFHRVNRFTANGANRIGLVLEQYRIEPKFYGLTVEYCLNDSCGEDEKQY